MEVSITEVSFHQVQRVYVENICTPILAATSLSGTRMVNDIQAKYFVVLLKTEPKNAHNFFEITIKLPQTKCYMFQNIMAYIRGHTIVPSS